jgi:hypothetical protein
MFEVLCLLMKRGLTYRMEIAARAGPGTRGIANTFRLSITTLAVVAKSIWLNGTLLAQASAKRQQ